MKSKLTIAIALALLPVLLVAQNRVKYAHFVKTVASTATPEAITSTNLHVSSVSLLGLNGVRTTNTATVFIGWTSGDDTQFFPLAAGGEVVIQARQGQTLNLKDIYIDVTANSDGVGVYYEP